MILDYSAWLTRRALGHLESGQEIPNDLFMEMVSAGINVVAIEKPFLTPKSDTTIPLEEQSHD